MTRTPPALLALLATGCVIGSDQYPRPGSLSEAWYIDRPRLLGVRASPAEAQPGEVVHFEALLPDPTGSVENVLWIACPFVQGEESAVSCELDFGALDPETASLEELIDAGVFGFEPGLPPVYTVPEDTLEGVEDPEGTYITIQTSGLPALEPEDTAIDFAAIEAGLKRLPVSESESPNANPEPAAFTIGGSPVPPGSIVEVDPHGDYELSVELADGAIQDYTYTNSDGQTEERVEEPYISWYCSSGEMREDVTLYPYPEATWRAGSIGQSGSWWAVIRDRRGGISWVEQPFVVGRGLATAP